MFAARRKIVYHSKKVSDTPLLIPSFSSKGFPEVCKILETTEEIITDTIMVSAYDIYYKDIPNEISFPELIFIDSGGYEASKDVEFSDLGYSVHEPSKWSQDKHKQALNDFNFIEPTVVISYDHPDEKCLFSEQVERARDLFTNFDCIKEVLVKPEKSDQYYINIEKFLDDISLFLEVDILGFTEKEIGHSILKRMQNIALIRNKLSEAGVDIPIHIFGSLDTITSPLYFLSGADIFDGLTWLRFAYLNGYTSYIHNYTALNVGIQTKDQVALANTWYNNYYYLSDLQMQMARFLNGGDFNVFKFHSDLFSESFQSLIAKLGVN